MDAIEAIIVTAFVNLLITGTLSTLIFYRYQKKLENSFAESFLEYQIKFVRNHQKRMETLENWYKKFRDLIEKSNSHTTFHLPGGEITSEISSVQYREYMDVCFTRITVMERIHC